MFRNIAFYAHIYILKIIVQFQLLDCGRKCIENRIQKVTIFFSLEDVKVIATILLPGILELPML